MAAGIAALDVVILALVLGLFVKQTRGAIDDNLRRFALLAIFVLAFGSAVGSLYIQYGMNLPPCILCWWQRIFMYPIVLISGIAFVKNAKFSYIADYVLALAILGALVSLYQHLLQTLPTNPLLIPCDATGDCAVRSVFEFGFVTLPWMAFTVFVAISLLAFVARKDK